MTIRSILEIILVYKKEMQTKKDDLEGPGTEDFRIYLQGHRDAADELYRRITLEIGEEIPLNVSRET